MAPDRMLRVCEQHPHETVLLELAVLAQERLHDQPDREYQLGIRDACLTVAALTLTRGTGRDTEQVRDQLTAAVIAGQSDAPRLLRLGMRAAGRAGEPGHGLDLVGPRAFHARHGHAGVDEDLAASLGPHRSIRLAWRREPGSHVGLLYAHDQLWDEYAVVATRVDRDLAHEAYRHAALDRGVEL